MTKSGKDYTFSIVGTTKTSKQGKRKPDISFHRFPEDHSLCPYKTLEYYLEFSKTWREAGDKNQLLLSHIETHSAVSTATVACWVKGVLGMARVDISIFKGRSVRAASTYKTKVMVLSTKDILKRGNWSRELTWQKYYRKYTLYLIQNTSKRNCCKGERFKQRSEYPGARYNVQESWVQM